jgi:kinesin family protein 5
MLGEGMGVELNVRALGLEDDDEMMAGGETSGDPRRNPEVTEGMIPRVVADLLEYLDDAPDSVEYTVRCSFVEIYLEKICDLLQPWREEVRIGQDENGEASVVGACEVCCLDVADIYALLARGNAYRTKAATDQNMDSSRSHAVFTLRLEKVNRDTGSQVFSRLLLLDLAGSETGKRKASVGHDAAAMEGKLINASLASLSNVVGNTLALQGNKKVRYKEEASESKLARLLRPCFGGNWHTAIICTGSPSSYNVNETISTIKFGQQAREVKNTPKAATSWTVAACQNRLTLSEKRQEDLTALVKMLAHECKHVKGRSKGKDSGNVPLWEAIEKITSSTKPGDVKELSVTIGSQDTSSSERIAELEQLLEEHRLAREKAESGMRDMKSEITSLRRQKESIANEKQRMSRELHDANEEIKILNQKNMEVENFLRTSQFREKEAIFFLRQFRTFYFRLLRSKALQGTGSTKDVTAEVSLRIPGVSDLRDLLDVDKLMLDSGLIEESEMGSDTNAADYEP